MSAASATNIKYDHNDDDGVGHDVDGNDDDVGGGMRWSIRGRQRHVYLVTVRSPNNQKPFQNNFGSSFIWLHSFSNENTNQCVWILEYMLIFTLALKTGVLRLIGSVFGIFLATAVSVQLLTKQAPDRWALGLFSCLQVEFVFSFSFSLFK